MQTTHPVEYVDEFFDPESLLEGRSGVEHPLIRSDAEHWGVYFGVTITPGDARRNFKLVIGARTNQLHPEDTYRTASDEWRYIYYVILLDQDGDFLSDEESQSQVPELTADAGSDWWEPWSMIVGLRQHGVDEVARWLKSIPEFDSGLMTIINPLWNIDSTLGVL